MNEDEALRTALEALEFIPESGSMLGAHAEEKRVKAITAIKQALAAQRQWVGLTDEEVQTTWDSVLKGPVFTRREVYKAIEVKLRSKNT